jgi:F0F1-type ATP synthase delta subunit
LAENGRGGLIKKILVSFKELLAASRGEVQVTVTSAKVFIFKFRNLMRKLFPGLKKFLGKAS